MSSTQSPQNPDSSGTSLEQIKESVCSLLDAMWGQESKDVERDFDNFYDRARELVHRKLSMTGTKSETRDLLGEVLFSRLRRGLRQFTKSTEGLDELKCAEWVMGALVNISTLSEFSAALDRAILELSAPREFSFAGMADFISMEEVMQLLGSGRHVGCLTFEKPDNRLDIYLDSGRIAYLDPHHMTRRILPGRGSMDYREIDEETMRAAEERQAAEDVPLFLALKEAGVFEGLEMRSVMQELGSEALNEFLMEPEAVFFSYRRVADLPDFVKQYDLRLSITGLLLEGNKRLDDWKSMCKVFPDHHDPVEPMPDMYARISGLDLGVIEIKLLAHINGENSPKAIAELLGLPLSETYQYLVRFANEGAVVAPGGVESINDVMLTTEESMRLAFEALDANDDQLAVSSALDSVFGDDDCGGGLFGDGGGETRSEDEGSGQFKVSLDFLKAAGKDEK